MSASGSLVDDMVLETKDGQMALSILVNMQMVKRREQALSKLVTALFIQVNGLLIRLTDSACIHGLINVSTSGRASTV